MICLLRNLTKIASPLHGFDKLPKTTEINDGADLARVKVYRNMICHFDKDTISTSDFNNIWKDLVQVGMTILDWCSHIWNGVLIICIFLFESTFVYKELL